MALHRPPGATGYAVAIITVITAFVTVIAVGDYSERSAGSHLGPARRDPQRDQVEGEACHAAADNVEDVRVQGGHGVNWSRIRPRPSCGGALDGAGLDLRKTA